jgi:hypothetical protein
MDDGKVTTDVSGLALGVRVTETEALLEDWPTMFSALTV